MAVQIKYGEYTEYLAKYNAGLLDSDTLYFTKNPNHIYKGYDLYSGGATGAIRLTMSQFDALVDSGTLNMEAWYFVTNTDNNLKFIYAGDTLVAKSDSEGSFGFPYSFPFNF